MTLHEFLNRFGEPLAQRVTQTFDILHDPVRDAGATPELDTRLATLLRPCYPAQAEAAKALARAFFDERQRAAYVCGEMGVGKAQPLHAKILTPDGWRLMGDIKAGDPVIGADGHPTLVIGVYPQGVKLIYRVTLSDGSSTQCCEDHLWQVITPLNKWKGKSPKVMSLKEIMTKGLAHANGNLQHFIPRVRPVAFPRRAQPLDPYLLGVLLGDGGLEPRSIHLSSADEELLDHVRRVLPQDVKLRFVSRYSWVLTTGRRRGNNKGANSVLQALRMMGLAGRRSEEKFIPELYAFGSIEQRIALLQGLLDTDGYAAPDKSTIEYYTVSPRLADDVAFLTRSLGGTVRCKLKYPTYTHRGERRNGQPAYRLTIALPNDIQPFRLSRKRGRYRLPSKYQPSRAIASIEPVGHMKAQCIRVEAPDGLYVTDDCIVTHNSQITLALLALAPRPLRTLVMCPPHLVPKWQREAEAILPHVRVVPLAGPDSLAHLTRLARARRTAGSIAPDVPEVWVLGRERAKLHHSWRPAASQRLRHRSDHQKTTPPGQTPPLLVWREPACLRCGRPLVDTDGVALNMEQLGKKHTFCPHCGEPAFTADHAGPRRYAPAEFIKRHLCGAFDLFVADEVHELKGEATGQGNAFGALAAACKQTLALTGTLLGGYADNLFFLLWRSHPTEMATEGLDYRKVSQWMERYGILERITRIRPDEDGWDARTVRGKNRRTSIRRKPGVSPLILGKHLLPTTIFLRLGDVAEALPPYEERVISLKMSPALAEAYADLANALLSQVRQALASGSRHLLSLYLQSLLCYPDQAAFRPETVIDPHTQAIIATAPTVPGPLPKEEELVELCTKEVRGEGRRVLVYVTFTETRDLTGRVKDLLTDAGFRVAVLKGTVDPGQREQWIQDRMAEGVEVLIANPELVKTGLDLIQLPTFIYLCPGYSIYTLRQAARRAWRIGQTQPCRVIFLTYEHTMQSKALTLIATKLEASLAVEGELSDTGLSALADSSDSLVIELARALVDRVGTTESAETVWARLRKRDMEQMLTLTAATPTPRVTALSESIERIGDKMLIVDLIEHTHPRRKKVSRLEVKAAELEQLLQERPHLAQLALF